MVWSGLLTSPASAQIVVHDVSGEVVFRDLTFKLPGPGWQRVSDADQATPAALRFGRADALHAFELRVASGQASGTLSSREVIEAHTHDLKKVLDAEHAQNYQSGTRTIDGAAYASFSWRVVPDSRPVADVTQVVWVPNDFGARGRYFWAMLVDFHSASLSAAPLDDLDKVVASFQTQEIGEVLFVDRPDDPDAPKLPTLSDERGVAGYVDGEYAMQTIPDGPSGWLVRPAGPGTRAHTITSVDVHLVSGDDPAQIMYVGCRWTGSGDNISGYRLGIQPLRGLFSLQRRDKDNKVTQLVGWRNSDAIHQGLDANHLELVCAGNTIGVAINGTPLALVLDRTYLEGLTMLEVASQSGPMEGRFANLTVAAH